MGDVTHTVAVALQWICFGLSFVSFGFYGYKVYRNECGWEVIYICAVESVKYVLELAWETKSPATLYVCDKALYEDCTSSDVVIAPWLRYAEWLLTCPVILIALSNLSGLKDDYNFRTMKLLCSDQGTIIMGVTAAYSTGGVKAAFFTVGVFYGLNTFYTAFLVYAEAFENVPPGKSKKLVVQMAYLFYASWIMFPILFLAGPEGWKHLNSDGSLLGHTFADLLSKNLWGLWSLWLRAEVREHHRKLWMEEQAREQMGKAAFDVPKEMRPDFNEAVNNFLNKNPTGALASYEAMSESGDPVPIEQAVDPFYAEYRRKRRARRGSLSGQPGSDPLKSAAPAPILEAAPAAPIGGPLAPSASGSGGEQWIPMQLPSLNDPGATAASSPLFNPTQPTAQQQTQSQMRVLVGEAKGDFGTFYARQMEMQHGAFVQVASSPEEFAMHLSRTKFTFVLAADNFLPPNVVMQIRSVHQVPIIGFGLASMETCGMAVDDYLTAPMMGVAYTPMALNAIVSKWQNGGPRGQAGGQPMGGMGMQMPPAQAPAAGGASGGGQSQTIEKLLADIASLKTTLAT